MEINIEQLSKESGVDIKGILTKGDVPVFLNLTKEELAKVLKSLKTHVPIKPIIIQKPTIQDIMTKLKEVENKLILKPLFEELKTYTKDGKMITDSELNLIINNYGVSI